MTGRSPKNAFLVICYAFLVLAAAAPLHAQTAPGAIRIEVDATRAPQKIMHAHMEMPVQPGPL